MVIPDTVRGFIKKNSVASIATIPADSEYPHIVPVFYVTDAEEHIYFISAMGSAKLANIAARPHVALSITEPGKLRTLELKATAVIVKKLEPKDHKILDQISRVSSEGSKFSFPPVMQIDGKGIQLVQLTIQAFHFANYAGHETNVLTGP